ncbi:maleylacetoacetate isomerase [Tropicimonas sp. TH_r6]|uniref:maleylacetoacetate isomerase n=1 Tax=Tropicimonas sp. TH_r6 TaxID=3082085 RepID=UPI002955A7D5|nr:maleylacetoacetate isomerase [Tropicimonas sp. TH_r6]MDV7143638.1 maleylacetoacetate isomerase [Tropicimonas sp. TH_r6]
MKLHSYWRSTTSYRVRIALNLKGLTYETVPVDLLSGAQRSPAYRALNPGAGVPTLELADGTVLTQSLAILDYLDHLVPEPPLLPADPLDRAHVQAAAHLVALDIHPVNNLRIINRLKTEHGVDNEAAKAWMLHWMAEGLAAFQQMLPANTRYCFGDAPMLADICLVAQLYNAHRWGLDLAPFARLLEIERDLLILPAFDAARPENQPDAP